MKKFVSFALALAMVLSLAACGQPAANNSGAPVSSGDPAASQGVTLGEFQPMTYEEQVVYDTALGEFYNAFMKAKTAVTSSERYALMAVAEAKMLESGVMIPTQGDGGR